MVRSGACARANEESGAGMGAGTCGIVQCIYGSEVEAEAEAEAEQVRLGLCSSWERSPKSEDQIRESGVWAVEEQPRNRLGGGVRTGRAGES